jgi:hypothetical protein
MRCATHRKRKAGQCLGEEGQSIGKEWLSIALEKKSQVMLWRRSAEQRIASEMHRKEPHRKSYACPGHA